MTPASESRLTGTPPQEMTIMTTAVVDADGTFGTHATVWFCGSLDECKAFAKRTHHVQVLVGCCKPAGEKIRRGELKLMKQAGLWQVR